MFCFVRQVTLLPCDGKTSKTIGPLLREFTEAWNALYIAQK
jgi:hypothetical protein